MLKENKERNATIHRYWEKGYTIDQTVSATLIPRSSVGYYFTKFGKYRREGRSLEFSTSEEPPLDPYVSFILKANFVQRVVDMFREGKFQDAYYFLMSLKCFEEYFRRNPITPDEKKILDEAIRGHITPPAKTPQPSEPAKVRSIVEIMDRELEKNRLRRESSSTER